MLFVNARFNTIVLSLHFEALKHMADQHNAVQLRASAFDDRDCCSYYYILSKL